MKPVLAVLAAAALLAGCSTNPITGRSQFTLVSEQMAIGSSSAAYAQMVGQLEKKKQLELDTPRAQRVREITDKLIAQAVRFRPDSASWQWEVKVINDPKVVNAFCMAGGKMAIYSGFWEKLKATDDEIAAVMGHEIGHALASHTRERMSVAMGSSVAGTIAAAAVSSRGGGSFEANNQLAQMAAALAIQLPNSREGELEADQIGIELAARAGFDPHAAVTLWEKMGKEGGNPPEFLSTHPSPENRRERLQQLVAKVDPLYQAARGKTESGTLAADTPRFLPKPGEGINERPLGTLSREEYAERVAREPDTMTFLSEPFERFKRGDVVLECRLSCAFGYATKKGGWKSLHANGQWRDLAVSVLQVGYLSDLSYFLLAEAARGLGLEGAAGTYYQRALQAGREYGCGAGFDCEGFDVQKKASAALARTSSR